MCRMDKMNETFVQSCRFHSCGSGPFLSNYSIIKSVMERKKEGKKTATVPESSQETLQNVT